MSDASAWAEEYAGLTLRRIERIELGLDRVLSGALGLFEPETPSKSDVATLLDSAKLFGRLLRGVQECLSMRQALQYREEARMARGDIGSGEACEDGHNQPGRRSRRDIKKGLSNSASCTNQPLAHAINKAPRPSGGRASS